MCLSVCEDVHMNPEVSDSTEVELLQRVVSHPPPLPLLPFALCPSWGWEWNLGPLQGQQVLLTTEPSLQPLSVGILGKCPLGLCGLAIFYNIILNELVPSLSTGYQGDCCPSPKLQLDTCVS